ncbi:MAG: beta-lactamase family protein [Gemmatimonadaceae bacterium]|nr:beta-lactamase family protein [Gemmatimonadaceae bacterium]
MRRLRQARPALLLSLIAVGVGAVDVAAQSPNLARLDSIVAAELERSKTPGVQVAVALDGKVVFSKGYGVADIETQRPVSAQTLFRVGSVTKMVTGAVLTQLAADGKLDLHAPISRYVPELEGKKVGTVTSHQLMTHNAGWLDNAVPYGRMGEGALGEVMREISDTMFFTEPGRILSYSNPSYSMAGYVAEQAGGKRFGTLADELVISKMGMPHATFRPLAALTRDFSQGHVGMPQNPGAVVRPFTENTAQWAAGFLMASAQDMARFAITIMDGGMLDGRRVLSADAVRMLTTPGTRIPNDTTVGYSYGLMIGRGKTSGERFYQHGGAINGFDALLTMFPDKRLAVVVLDNRGGNPMPAISAQFAKEFGGVPFTVPSDSLPPGRKPTAAEARAMAGVYAMGRTQLELKVEGDSVILQQGIARLPVLMLSENSFFIKPPMGDRQTLWLIPGPDGRIAYLSASLRALARKE